MRGGYSARMARATVFATAAARALGHSHGIC